MGIFTIPDPERVKKGFLFLKSGSRGGSILEGGTKGLVAGLKKEISKVDLSLMTQEELMNYLNGIMETVLKKIPNTTFTPYSSDYPINFVTTVENQKLALKDLTARASVSEELTEKNTITSCVGGNKIKNDDNDTTETSNEYEIDWDNVKDTALVVGG